MIVFPNCKINLGLHITSKRPDGFHNLETIFYPIPICDSLEIVPSPDLKDHLYVHNIPMDGPMEENLVYKALALLRKDFTIPSVRIDLLKNIPMGAGLGGGSADAAFMLKLCNETYELGLSQIQLEDYARVLGSDCAFFIANEPVYAEGKGDEFSEVEVDLSAYQLLVVKPIVHISTADAYAGVVPQDSKVDLRELVQRDISEWRNTLVNDFEEGIFAKFPEIKAVKEQLYALGATYACMSGSGASVFGLFEKAVDIPANEFQGCFVFQSK